MFKNCDGKTKNMGNVSYQHAVIEDIMRDNSIKICYKVALVILGSFYVYKFDICQLDAVDKIELVDGDHAEKKAIIWRRKLMMKKMLYSH